MASSEKTESVNAVYIEHLTKSVDILSTKVDGLLSLFQQSKEETHTRQEKTDVLARKFTSELASLTATIDPIQTRGVKNEEKINQLEKQYVSRQYLHKWLLSIAAMVIASIAWQDLQTQRYFNKLESTIALTDAQNKELEHYRHFLKNDFLEAYQHFQKAKKGM